MALCFARAFLGAGDRVVALCPPLPPEPPGRHAMPNVADALAALGVPVDRAEGSFERAWDLALVARTTRWLLTRRVELVVAVQQSGLKIAGLAARLAGL